MPRPRKGARLYLRTDRIDRRTGRALPDVYVILDGSVERSTGFAGDRLQDAEQALADYILAKNAAAPAAQPESPGDPASVLIAEVLALYARERAPELRTEAQTLAGFLRKLGEWWFDKTIADVRRSSCKAYVTWRTSQAIGSATKAKNPRLVSDQTARRELEVLSTAIGFWHGEYTLSSRPEVWLPAKTESTRDALTRSQAAALLLATMGWRRRTAKDGPGAPWIRRRAEDITNRRHLRRYLLIGLYTGTRSKVITSALWEEALLQAWVDLDRGQIFRRGRGEREVANKRRPVVRLPSRLLAHMRRWREADLRLEAKIRAGDQQAGTPPDPEFRLLSVIHFNAAPIERVKRSFGGCIRDAGLPEDVTPHWLRHTAATWLMEGGADLWDASAYLGMSPTMIEKNYGHHRPDHQAAARRAIGGRKHAV